MKCPKCNTNIMGVNSSCPVCGYSTNTSNTDIKPTNGIIDKRDYFNTNRNMEEYTKKKDSNINLPIIGIIIFLILIILLIIFILIKLFN